MSKTFLALVGAAVVMTATPAIGRHVTVYRVGYTFGPSYSYTEYSALPQPIIVKYNLKDNYRYVSDNGYIYVVSPKTYRVVRVIKAPM